MRRRADRGGRFGAWVVLVLGTPLLAAAGRSVPAPAEPVNGSRHEAAAAPIAAAHDLHIAYADMAIEGDVVAGRIRMFKNDLEKALGPLVNADAMTLEAGPEADAMVLRYVRAHLEVRVPGASAAAPAVVLEPRLLQSGEDELDREPVWWVIVEYRAPREVGELHVRNTLLFDRFKDQRNIMKFVRFPEEKQKTFYFAPGEENAVVEQG